MGQRRPLLRLGRRNPPADLAAAQDPHTDRVHRQSSRDAEMHADRVQSAACPVDSQIGTVSIPNFGIFGIFFPLYNMETSPNQAGLLGFITPLISAPVFLELTSRTNSDYGLDTVSTPQIKLGINFLETTLWGVPGRPETQQAPLHHAAHRARDLLQLPERMSAGQSEGSETFAKSNIPEKPFLQNPTTCGVPRRAGGGRILRRLRTRAKKPNTRPTTGCQQLSFSPSVLAKPTTDRADTASGLDLTIKVPQTQSGETPVVLGAAKLADHPAGGIHDQPQRGRRQGRLPGHPGEHRDAVRSALPAVLEDRDACRSTSRRCRGRSRGRSTWPNRNRANRTG